ncbi:MAG TPA: hypothetical protein VL048_05930 [Xanthobacteraceae bacterium]|nr:hypothetical protein [Xanthobacteraceae bacterium]
MELIAVSMIAVTVAVENASVFEAVKRYLELEAACLIPGGEAWRPNMKQAEREAVDLIARHGGTVRLGPLTVESHVAFEGEREIGRWFTIKGPAGALGILTDAANTSAHTKLRTPWKHGLAWEDNGYLFGTRDGKRTARKAVRS